MLFPCIVLLLLQLPMFHVRQHRAAAYNAGAGGVAKLGHLQGAISRSWLVQNIPPAFLQPQDIHLAQLQLRLSSPNNVSSVLGGQGNGGLPPTKHYAASGAVVLFRARVADEDYDYSTDEFMAEPNEDIQDATNEENCDCMYDYAYDYAVTGESYEADNKSVMI